jgi:hypothetical protein
LEERIRSKGRIRYEDDEGKKKEETCWRREGKGQ